MKISTRVRYAVRLMADIAKYAHQGEAVSLRDVAGRQHISRLYLSQLAVPLRNASLLKSVWGNRGGYMLGRPAAEIRLLDIVEAVDGPVCVLECLADGDYCMRSQFCECIGVWREVNDGIVRALASRTLAELASAPSKKGASRGSRPSCFAAN